MPPVFEGHRSGAVYHIEGHQLTFTESSPNLMTRLARVVESIITCCGPPCCGCHIQELHDAIRGIPRSETIDLQPVESPPTGTVYGPGGISAYIEHGHGPNGKRILDPCIKAILTGVKDNAPLLDTGCNGGEWPFFAANLGMTVYANDIQPEMITAAKERAVARGFLEHVNFMVGDATQMTVFNNEFFGTALSTLVGCNLTSAELLNAHISELKRVTKVGGKVILTAPESLEQIFTSGKRPSAQIIGELNVQLATFNQSRLTAPSLEETQGFLNGFTDILSATFVITGNALVLVKEISQLTVGQQIYRKLPNNVIPNHYYPVRLYEEFFSTVGLKVVECRQDKLTQDELQQHNAVAKDENKLGPEYVDYPIFSLWVLQREASVRVTYL